MFKKALLALTVAGSLVLTGCGGGGGGGDDTAPEVKRNDVAGPLDSVQGQLSSDVLAPLTQSLNGTPLAGVVNCVDQAVVNDVLDVVDALALSIQPGANPTTAVTVAAADVQAELGDLVTDLQGLVLSLAGTTGCANIPIPLGSLTNPLAGTPLEALGAALLPTLLSVSQQLAPLPGGGAPSLSAVQLSGLVAQLSSAFTTGLAALPPEVLTAPLVGGSLVTVDDALAQLAALSSLAATGGSPESLAAGLQALSQSVLGNLLTQVLPVANLQDLAGGGVPTDVVGTLQAAVASLVASLGTDPTGALPANPLSGVGFASLTTLLDTLTAQLPTALTGSSGLTALEAALGQVQTLLNTLLGIGGGGGGGGSCQLGLLGLCLVP